jgi:hypothetical protein
MSFTKQSVFHHAAADRMCGMGEGMPFIQRQPPQNQPVSPRLPYYPDRHEQITKIFVVCLRLCEPL